MAHFSYRAVDLQGRTERSTLQADSARHARELLRERGLRPLACEALAVPGLGRQLHLRQGELAQMARQLATLVQAALPLEEALAAVAEQSLRAKVRSLLLAVRTQVLEGQPLAGALGVFGCTFPELFRATVAAGEHAGRLGLVLEQLADYIEARQASARRIQMALVYPGILLCASLAIVGFLLGYVVPDVVAMFTDGGRPLPALTHALISVSHAVRDHGIAALTMLCLAGIALRVSLRRPLWRLRWHSALLRLPVAGALWRAGEAARFASTLSIMGKSAVPLVEVVMGAVVMTIVLAILLPILSLNQLVT